MKNCKHCVFQTKGKAIDVSDNDHRLRNIYYCDYPGTARYPLWTKDNPTSCSVYRQKWWMFWADKEPTK